MPKSSTDRCTPVRARPSSTARARSGSAITADSVTSRVRACGGRPAAASMDATRVGRARSSSTRGERLTATRSSRPSSRNRASSANERRSTCSVSAVISPLRSASGTKSSGETMPRTGCRHRTSASAETTRPVAGSTDGWKNTSSCSAATVRRRSAYSSRRSELERSRAAT